MDRIRNLVLRDFTAFDDAEFEFSPGINVLIGANATGKSHVMKVMYSVLKTTTSRRQLSSSGEAQYIELVLGEKLDGVFKPADHRIGRLVKRARGRNHAEATIEVDGGTFSFQLSTLGKVTIDRQHVPEIAGCLFLPTRELLSMYPGFIAAYEGRDLEFDETYYDLCLALSASPLKGPRLQSAEKLLRPLEKALLRKVVLKSGHFFLQSRGEGQMEAHLAAEGFRKLGSLMHLIMNGSLTNAGLLFWDEPETNLNPRLVTTVAKLLWELARAGVQIFIATHDYLLVNELSLAAEYETPEGKAAKTRFFCLSRQRAKGPIEIHAGETISEIENNPILEEFSAHYEREQRLFHGDSTGRTP